MTIERNHAGAWVISDMVRGYLVTRLYVGYSKRDAVSLFNHYVMDLIEGGKVRHS
jgi:hypothetical protein